MRKLSNLVILATSMLVSANIAFAGGMILKTFQGKLGFEEAQMTVSENMHTSVMTYALETNNWSIQGHYNNDGCLRSGAIAWPKFAADFRYAILNVNNCTVGSGGRITAEYKISEGRTVYSSGVLDLR